MGTSATLCSRCFTFDPKILNADMGDMFMFLTQNMILSY